MITIESLEISLRSSPDLYLYLFFGSLSVKENKFLLILIVFIKCVAFSSISSSLLRSSAKNLFERDSTIGNARI